MELVMYGEEKVRSHDTASGRALGGGEHARDEKRRRLYDRHEEKIVIVIGVYEVCN